MVLEHIESEIEGKRVTIADQTGVRFSEQSIRLYTDETPVLFGHYWMRVIPRILNSRASCLDFSVANGGFLTAYRWSGESELEAANLVWVPA